MLSDAQRNLKRTAARMETWLDDVKRGPARAKLLRGLMIRGMRLAVAPDAQRDPERVFAAPAAVLPHARPAMRAEPAPRVTCMSFESCGGTGVLLAVNAADGPDGYAHGAEFCTCAAGVTARARATASRP